MEIVTALDISRLVIGVAILSYACYTDIKTRMAPNILWILMGSAGAIILLIQYLTGNIQNLIHLLFIPIIIAIVYIFFHIGLIFGGADAKAIMSLAILNPFWPSISGYPSHSSIFPFSWVIFTNSIIIFLLIPPSLLIYNAVKREVEFPFALLGYKMDIEKAKEKFVWPLEKVEDGKKKLMLMPEDFDTSKHIEELEKQGFKRIWVTPKIPFMVPLLIGFVTAFFYGDIMFSIIDFLM